MLAVGTRQCHSLVVHGTYSDLLNRSLLRDIQANNWTFVWYAVTVLTSVFENYASAPFVKSWEMRISRAPKLRISTNAPWICTPERDNRVIELSNMSQASSPDLGRTDSTAATSSLLLPPSSASSVIENLKKGYNTTGHIIMNSNTPCPAPKNAFYVIISQEGTTPTTTALRLFAKTMSVAAFTMSTALFASSTLVTIRPAVIIMTTILASGIFGRVTAMWFSAVIMRDRPVLHRVVKSEEEAGVFMEAVLQREGLVREVLGHVVVGGRCVGTCAKVNWSLVFGVLSKPSDIVKIALRGAV
jgi:hypothetical protein